VVARIAKELGALTVGIVTTPFKFEGTRRLRQATDGVGTLRSSCDTVIVVPNERLLEVLDRETSMLDAFRIADDVLRQGVQGICDLITLPGLINLDFADVRTIMTDAGAPANGGQRARRVDPERELEAARLAHRDRRHAVARADQTGAVCVPVRRVAHGQAIVPCACELDDEPAPGQPENLRRRNAG